MGLADVSGGRRFSHNHKKLSILGAPKRGMKDNML